MGRLSQAVSGILLLAINTDVGAVVPVPLQEPYAYYGAALGLCSASAGHMTSSNPRAMEMCL